MRLKIECKDCEYKFNSNYCPNCGSSYEKSYDPNRDTFFKTYVHGDKDGLYEVCKNLGILEESTLYQNILYCTYEIGLIFKIQDDKVVLHQVDPGDGRGFLDVCNPVTPIIKNN